jgi:predicted ATPase
MKLQSVTIKNVKAIGPQGITLNLADDIVMAIGPNGVGKSSVLSGLRMFFEGTVPPRHEFHRYRTDKDHAAEVTVTFHRLNEQDKAYNRVREDLHTDEAGEDVWTLTLRFYIDEDGRDTQEALVGEEKRELSEEEYQQMKTLFDSKHMQWIYVPAREAVCEGTQSPFSQLFAMFRTWNPERPNTEMAEDLNHQLYEMMGVPDVLSVTPLWEGTQDFTLLPEREEDLFLNPRYQSHGVQRAVFFALLREYGDVVPRSRAEPGVQNMLLIEDPEMYMDPQMERTISNTLFYLAGEAGVQVVSTTHSAVFVRALEKPRSLIRLSRGEDEELQSFQVTEDVFAHESEEEEKEHRLRAVREFSPEVSALFFARQVVLVEGATEIVVLQRAAQLLGMFDYGVSLINCHGRGNIPMFQEVLNHFDTSYVVVHDLERQNPHEGLNQHILNLLDGDESRRFYHDPHLDAELDIYDSPKWLDGYEIVTQLKNEQRLESVLGDLVAFVFGE